MKDFDCTMVDAYANFDRESKDIKRQMDELRPIIVNEAEKRKNEFEKSVVLEGKKNELMVTYVEYISVNTKDKDYSKVKDFEFFDDIFDRKVLLNIDPKNLEKVIAVLNENGCGDLYSIHEDVKVSKNMFNNYLKTKFASKRDIERQNKVKKIIDSDVSVRIKVK